MSSSRVQEMTNFIFQEAHEKINELRLKTDHECALEKNAIVARGKALIDEEHEQRMKALEVQRKIMTSNAMTSVRVAKMKAREGLLGSASSGALDKLGAITKKPEYANLLKELLLQGLIKINEQNVQVLARAEDKAVLARVLSEAVAEYKAILKTKGSTLNPHVTISEQVIDSKSCRGGIILSALEGKVVINQTLDERLTIALYDLMPKVREVGTLSLTAPK